MTDLLDPRNDVVFKLMFVRRPDLLADLINSVRKDCSPIRELTIHNPAITPDEPHSKFIVLDIRATDSTGFQFDIEMQVRRDISYGARSAYYLAKLLTEQLEQGQGYGKLRPAIGIHLLDFTMFPEKTKQSSYHFCMRDSRDSTIVLGQELQLYVLEMRKMERDGTLGVALRDWIQFFEHAQEEDKMQTIEHAPVREALSFLAQLSSDQEAKYLALSREKALRDEVTALENARNEGIQVGLEQGLEQGLEKGLEQGLEKGREDEREKSRQRQAASLIRLARRRFGPLAPTLEERVGALPIEALDALVDDLLDFGSTDDLAAWLDGREVPVAADQTDHPEP